MDIITNIDNLSLKNKGSYKDVDEAIANLQDADLAPKKYVDDKSVYISVLVFGAVGDGETDDTAAIQQAINYAYDNNLMVYVPNGIYKINYQTPVADADWGGFGVRPFTAYCLYVKDGQTILGESRDDTIFIVDDTGVQDAIDNHSERSSYVIDSYKNGADNVKLINFTVDNNKPNTDTTYYGEGDVLSISGFNQSIKNVKVLNGLGDGVDLDFGSASVEGSHFENCGFGVNSNIDEGLLTNKRLKVSNCDFINNINGGVKGRLTFMEVTGCNFDGNFVDISCNEGPTKVGDGETQRVYILRGNSHKNTIRSYVSAGKRYIDTVIHIEGNTFLDKPLNVIESRSTDNAEGNYEIYLNGNIFEEEVSLLQSSSGGANAYDVYINDNIFLQGYILKNAIGKLIWGLNFVEDKVVGIDHRFFELENTPPNVDKIFCSIKKTGATNGDCLIGSLFTTNVSGGSVATRAANFARYDIVLGRAGGSWSGSVNVTGGLTDNVINARLVEYELDGDTWIGLLMDENPNVRGATFMEGKSAGAVNFEPVLADDVSNIVDFTPDVDPIHKIGSRLKIEDAIENDEAVTLRQIPKIIFANYLSPQVAISSGLSEIIELTEDFKDGDFTLSNDNENIIIPEDGYYEITSNLYLDSVSSSVSIRRGTVNLSRYTKYTNTQDHRTLNTGVIYLEQDDEINLYAVNYSSSQDLHVGNISISIKKVK